ncbi:MAG: hypothetical protein KJ630_16910 [Proteobacteria bacterium]|nr:hypothetical protein [Pseudomonadota bacterium]
MKNLDLWSEVLCHNWRWRATLVNWFMVAVADYDRDFFPQRDIVKNGVYRARKAPLQAYTKNLG